MRFIWWHLHCNKYENLNVFTLLGMHSLSSWILLITPQCNDKTVMYVCAKHNVLCQRHFVLRFNLHRQGNARPILLWDIRILLTSLPPACFRSYYVSRRRLCNWTLMLLHCRRVPALACKKGHCSVGF